MAGRQVIPERPTHSRTNIMPVKGLPPFVSACLAGHRNLKPKHATTHLHYLVAGRSNPYATSRISFRAARRLFLGTAQMTQGEQQ